VLLIDTDSQGHATLVTTGEKDYGIERGEVLDIMRRYDVPSHVSLFSGSPAARDQRVPENEINLCM